MVLSGEDDWGRGVGGILLGCAALSLPGVMSGSRRLGAAAFWGGTGGDGGWGVSLCERICGPSRCVLLGPFAVVGKGPAIRWVGLFWVVFLFYYTCNEMRSVFRGN